MASRLKLLANGVRALSAGVVTGVFLVTAYTYCEGLLAGCGIRDCLVPLSAGVRIACMVSLTYALLISACLAPVWLLLEKVNLANRRSAITIGFFAPITLWLFTNLNSYFGVWHVLLNGLPYALCGAAAGFAAWTTNSRARPDRS